MDVSSGRTAPSIKIANKQGLLAVHNSLALSDQRSSGPALRTDFGYGQSYFFAVQLLPINRLDVRLDGRALPITSLAQGSVQVIDQRRSWSAVLYPPFETVNFSVTQAVLDLLSEERDGFPVEVVAPPLAADLVDPTLLHLAHALMPAFRRPHELSALFAESVSLAVATHVLATYCADPRGLAARRGGLAPWQQRRAVELLCASIRGDVTLSELAAACALSSGHFARAFKQSFGIPPHRWLMLERVRRAQALIRDTTMPLGEVAIACGFADQSHFTRVFAATVAMPPGAWRRLHFN